jgi:hypothetical protein
MIISVFYGVLYDTTLAFRGLTAAIYLIHATSYYGCSIKSPTLSYHKTYHKIALKTIDLYTCIILPHNIIHHRTSAPIQESMTLFPQPSPNATYPECPHQSPSKSGGCHSLPILEPLRLNSAALRPSPPKIKHLPNHLILLKLSRIMHARREVWDRECHLSRTRLPAANHPVAGWAHACAHLS